MLSDRWSAQLRPHDLKLQDTLLTRERTKGQCPPPSLFVHTGLCSPPHHDALTAWSLCCVAPVPLSRHGWEHPRHLHLQSFALFSSGFGISSMARSVRESRAYTSGLTLPICAEFCWTLWLRVNWEKSPR